MNTSNFINMKHWLIFKFKLTPKNFDNSMWTDNAHSMHANLAFWLASARLGLCFSVIWVCISAILDYQLIICETSMFQRAGAVLVAAAALVEFGSQKPLHGWYMDCRSSELSWLERLRAFQLRGQKQGIFGLIAGTIIWAYGDFLSLANCN